MAPVRGTVSGELRAGAGILRMMLKEENLALRREGLESPWKRPSGTRMVRTCRGEAETEKDDAKDEAEGEPKKLPDGVWEGWGRAEKPQEEPGLHLGGSSGQRQLWAGGLGGQGRGHRRQRNLGIFRMSVSRSRRMGLSARQETWAWLRREAGAGDWWGRKWLGPRLKEGSQ